MHYVGLPPSGSPLILLAPLFLRRALQNLRRKRMSSPHPCQKGRGGVHSALAGALNFEPTYLSRGEGLAAESTGEAETERARAGVVVERWWWTKESGRRMKFNRDGVDGGFKLRFPSKIMFDISTCKSDSKLKN